MSNDDKKPEGLGQSWAHLFLGPDTRTPEERAEAQRRENARRKGRRVKDWWKKYPPTDLR